MTSDSGCIPRPKVEALEVNETVKESLAEQGVQSFLADILARRMSKPVKADSIFSPSLKSLADPSGIPSLDLAVDRIVKAIRNKEIIIFACDHDMDGTASSAVLWKAFVDHFNFPPENLEVVTSHRLTEGYGLTKPVVERILATDASLIITADKGSSDENQIKVLRDAGRDVIVTDHHAIPIEGCPESAYATVNPTRSDSHYDPHICGAAVAFMVMAKVRSALLRENVLDHIPSIVSLLDYVAVATVADCVSLRPDKSFANRVLVQKGLELINKKARPCWTVFLQDLKRPVNSEDISFQLAPPIAAAGRLDWAKSGFLFLISDSVQEAGSHWDHLIQENILRRQIEAGVREKAMEKALLNTAQSIVVYIEEGHSGVHGITASHLVQAFGKPVGIFSPKQVSVLDSDAETASEIASGSFRGVPGFHVRECLQFVDDHHPGLLMGFGGHSGAAGATILAEDIDRFAKAFDEGVVKQIGASPIQPIIFVDGDLPGNKLNLSTVDLLRALDPWGKDFPYPVFKGEFEVESFKHVGNGKHYSFLLSKDNVLIKGIWFNANTNGQMDDKYYEGDKIICVYKLTDNWFRGKRSPQLIIESIEYVAYV